MKYKTDIKDVSKWLIYNKPMSPKKIQKMLFFCYGYYLATYNDNEKCLDNQLFKNEFQAWVHGPVNPTIYNLYKSAGFAELSLEKFEYDFDDNVKKILNFVLKKYGSKNADELERITHTQLPWIEARKDLSPIDPSTKAISEETIYSYFKKEGLLVNE